MICVIIFSVPAQSWPPRILSRKRRHRALYEGESNRMESGFASRSGAVKRTPVPHLIQYRNGEESRLMRSSLAPD